MLTEEQKQARKDKIGGSDAPAICGEDPNKTAYGVALRITGQVESENLDELDHIQFGDEMEGVLGRFYVRKEKVQIVKPPQIIHPKIPFIACNIDFRVPSRPEIGIEAKNTGLFGKEVWGDPGTDDVPRRVLLQVQHCMACDPTIEEFHVLRCYGGNTYQKFVVPRHTQLIEDLVAIECEFMDQVRKGILPEPTWAHRSTKDLIKKAHRNIVGEQGAATEELEALTIQWRAAADLRLAWEKEEQQLKNRIEHACGEYGVVTLADGRYWRRATVRKKAYSVGATEYIECRLLKP